MIAIAIIGILALVLIPKVGGMKAQAKLAGLDTNMRIAVAAAEGIINDYDDTTIMGLESDLATKLRAGGVNAVKNPISGKVGVVEGTVVVATGAAFQYDEDADAAAEAADATAGYTATDATLAGVIRYDASYAAGQLTVKLMPYDDQGIPMTAKVKIVNK